MAVFSKPLSIPYTCYEVGHCWTPYCSKASIDIFKNVFREAIQIYGALYFIAGILRRRPLSYYWKSYITETVRSSLFLTINGTCFLGGFCLWRRIFDFYLFYNVYIGAIPICIACIMLEQKTRLLLGRVYLLSLGFLPAYVASFLAAVSERKSRRGPLALYLTNLAIETGFRMLVERKLVTPIQHGEVYLFSLASAVYLYLFRKQDGLPKSTESLFKFLVGRNENCPEVKKELDTNANSCYPSQDISPPTPSSPIAEKTPSRQSSSPSLLLEGYKYTKKWAVAVLVKNWWAHFDSAVLAPVQSGLKSFTSSLDELPRHHSCPHSCSCLSYITRGGGRMFALGYVAQLGVTTVSSLSTLLRRPAAVKNVLVNKNNFKLAAFLGSYSAVFRAVNCVLRWLRNKDSEIHGCVAGALAGLSLRFYKSVSVALYATIKMLEILYFKGVSQYKLPHFKNADILLYAVSTAFIFHAAVVEPHTIRAGYWRFLNRVTDNKLAMMNRRLLDVFGVNSSKIAPDYWPDYDPAFSSLVKPDS